MNSRTILVALNLADDRHPAFDHALALAEASDAELYVFHAVPADRPFGSAAAERLGTSATLRERAEAAGVEFHIVEQHGDPAELIALHADARGADLIVMGARRRTGWARLRRRSVVERVLRRTNRPVLAVPRENGGDGSAFESVLVAADLSPASAPLIATAMQLFGHGPGQLTFVHAIESLEAVGTVSRARWMVPEYRGHVVSDARARLEAALPSPVTDGADVRFRVATGPVGDAIEATAEEVGADLIVMGGSRRFRHLGSIAARVLRTIERPLLIIPEAAAAFMAGRREPIHARGA
jgi:nucleotide-binding universal stress UspA family protein